MQTMAAQVEQRFLSNLQYIERLKANATRCRELADFATDKETRQALLEMAKDMEAAIPILEENAPLKDEA